MKIVFENEQKAGHWRAYLCRQGIGAHRDSGSSTVEIKHDENGLIWACLGQLRRDKVNYTLED